jgi:GMP synthase (glutamine-hydrolysing)
VIAHRPYRLGLLVCGHVHPDALHVAGDYPDLFRALFEPLGFDIVPFDVDRGIVPSSVDECDGWVTSPSRASVNDDEDWIAGIETFVRRLVSEEVPFAGICFGHQLLARALGGQVQRAPSGWGVGAQRYDIVDVCPWMDPAADQVVLIASHEDQVVRLPDAARLLARSDHCPNAMFAIGPRAIGVQAHPEFTAELSRALIDLRVDLIGEATAAAARSSLSTALDRATVARWIGRFLRQPNPRPAVISQRVARSPYADPSTG